MISLDFENMLALMEPDVYAAWKDEIKLYYGSIPETVLTLMWNLFVYSA